VDDEEAEEEAEQALSTVDSEFGRTTDPVRMYMREMGSVELLTREGEIEIAKRIEDGLKHMIRRFPPARRPSPRCSNRRQGRARRNAHRRTGRRPDRPERRRGHRGAGRNEEARSGGSSTTDDEDDDGGGGAQSASLLQLKADALERFSTSAPVRQDAADAGQEGLAGQGPT
jgi:RNA polymerase primary sigma factor